MGEMHKSRDQENERPGKKNGGKERRQFWQLLLSLVEARSLERRVVRNNYPRFYGSGQNQISLRSRMDAHAERNALLGWPQKAKTRMLRPSELRRFCELRYLASQMTFAPFLIAQ